MSVITQGWGAGAGIPVTVAIPAYPNVASLPGVPQLARSLLFQALSPPTIGTPATSGAIWHATQTAPIWGVFDSNGNQVVQQDSVASFEWRKENRVSNYPIQSGQFGTFNRVGLPFEASIMLTKGGDEASRQFFLKQIDALIDRANINLYTIYTPEKTYQNVSCTRAELSRRGKDNAFYFDVELYFVEINEVDVTYNNVPTPTTNASVPSALPVTNQGLTNPLTPSSAVQQAGIAAIVPPTPTG